MNIYTYPITIQREGKQYYAYSEDFPGVFGLGKSIEGAKKGILDAMRLYLVQCKKSRKPIPAQRTVYSETVSVAIE
jgi:predicted RNase H-like HicB family nuclease